MSLRALPHQEFLKEFLHPNLPVQSEFVYFGSELLRNTPKLTGPCVQLTWQASLPPPGKPAHMMVSPWMGFFRVDRALEHSLLFRTGRLTSCRTWGSSPSETQTNACKKSWKLNTNTPQKVVGTLLQAALWLWQTSSFLYANLKKLQNVSKSKYRSRFCDYPLWSNSQVGKEAKSHFEIKSS